MRNSNSAILERIEDLDREVQRVKIAAVFELPMRELKALYPERELLRAIQDTRRLIWQKKYAKKVKGLS